jgi:hypothetical protein
MGDEPVKKLPWIVAMATVCIVSQSSAGLVDEARLVAEQYKLRRASNSIPVTRSHALLAACMNRPSDW